MSNWSTPTVPGVITGPFPQPVIPSATHPAAFQTASFQNLPMPPNTTGDDHPRLSYYIVRNSGKLVPLVPVDELPPQVSLRGVPQELPRNQAHHMCFIGTCPDASSTFQLAVMDDPFRRAYQPKSPQSGSLAPDLYNRSLTGRANELSHRLPFRNRHDITNEVGHSGETQPHISRSVPTLNSEKSTQSMIDAIVSSKSRHTKTSQHSTFRDHLHDSVLPPSGKLPDQDKKEFCTHWIRTGECDYLQQGCRYKHEMPDKATLLKIGFRTTPRWWLEKQSFIKPGLSSKATAFSSLPKSAHTIERLRLVRDPSSPDFQLAHDGKSSTRMGSDIDSDIDSDIETDCSSDGSSARSISSSNSARSHAGTTASAKLEDLPTLDIVSAKASKFTPQAARMDLRLSGKSGRLGDIHSQRVDQADRDKFGGDNNLIDFEPLIPTPSSSASMASVASSGITTTDVKSRSKRAGASIASKHKEKQPTKAFVQERQSAKQRVSASHGINQNTKADATPRRYSQRDRKFGSGSTLERNKKPSSSVSGRQKGLLASRYARPKSPSTAVATGSRSTNTKK